MIAVKQSVLTLPEYSVPQDLSVIKMNQNESPYDIPLEIKTQILKRMKCAFWNRYPVARRSTLFDALSQYTGHPKDGIVIGNGSNEMIQTVFSAACNAGDRVVMVKPGFAIYPRVAVIQGLVCDEIPLLDDFSFDIQTILEHAQQAKLVIVASPNVPTGIALSTEDLEAIGRKTRGVFVVDEAYFEFCEDTAQALLGSLDNMVIIRTFSKAFSLAGARLGYLLTSPMLAQAIDKAKLPFSVGIFQHTAGEILLQNRGTIRETVKNITSEREKMFNALRSIPNVSPIPSQANFILMHINQKLAKDVFNDLYEKGVLIRCFNTPELKNMLRVTIGKPNENEKFMECMIEVMSSKEGS
jgi:histidinol-phosphate aminotransferase